MRDSQVMQMRNNLNAEQDLNAEQGFDLDGFFEAIDTLSASLDDVFHKQIISGVESGLRRGKVASALNLLPKGEAFIGDEYIGKLGAASVAGRTLQDMLEKEEGGIAAVNAANSAKESGYGILKITYKKFLSLSKSDIAKLKESRQSALDGLLEKTEKNSLLFSEINGFMSSEAKKSKDGKVPFGAAEKGFIELRAKLTKLKEYGFSFEEMNEFFKAGLGLDQVLEYMNHEGNKGKIDDFVTNMAAAESFIGKSKANREKTTHISFGVGHESKVILEKLKAAAKIKVTFKTNPKKRMQAALENYKKNFIAEMRKDVKAAKDKSHHNELARLDELGNAALTGETNIAAKFRERFNSIKGDGEKQNWLRINLKLELKYLIAERIAEDKAPRALDEKEHKAKFKKERGKLRKLKTFDEVLEAYGKLKGVSEKENEQILDTCKEVMRLRVEKLETKLKGQGGELGPYVKAAILNDNLTSVLLVNYFHKKGKLSDQTVRFNRIKDRAMSLLNTEELSEFNESIESKSDYDAIVKLCAKVIIEQVHVKIATQMFKAEDLLLSEKFRLIARKIEKLNRKIVNDPGNEAFENELATLEERKKLLFSDGFLKETLEFVAYIEKETSRALDINIVYSEKCVAELESILNRGELLGPNGTKDLDGFYKEEGSKQQQKFLKEAIEAVDAEKKLVSTGNNQKKHTIEELLKGVKEEIVKIFRKAGGVDDAVARDTLGDVRWANQIINAEAGQRMALVNGIKNLDFQKNLSEIIEGNHPNVKEQMNEAVVSFVKRNLGIKKEPSKECLAITRAYSVIKEEEVDLATLKGKTDKEYMGFYKVANKEGKIKQLKTELGETLNNYFARYNDTTPPKELLGLIKAFKVELDESRVAADPFLGSPKGDGGNNLTVPKGFNITKFIAKGENMQKTDKAGLEMLAFFIECANPGKCVLEGRGR